MQLSAFPCDNPFINSKEECFPWKRTSISPTAPEQFGKNADGTTNGDYCVYCCPNGEANMTGTLDEMIDFCAPLEVKLGLFPDEKAARDTLSRYLPTLKRWRG